MSKKSPLGQPTVYIEKYAPDLLFPIPRSLGREKIGLELDTPFEGCDIWNAYEISWLTPKGKPEIAMGRFSFPANSHNVVESKSLKLYLNSFNQSCFSSFKEVQSIIQKDLSTCAETLVSVEIFRPNELKTKVLSELSGFCLDHLDIETDTYEVNKHFLMTTPDLIEETLYTNLLKSNCLATGQPDWGSVWIHYKGRKILHEELLKYFISFRKHAGFAEHCIEQIFCDILSQCKPDKLTVYGHYTRRGGLDISPFRSNFEEIFLSSRQFRQ